MDFIALIVSIILGALLYGLVIWVVGRMGMGMEVDGFGPAFIAALVIALVAGIVNWLLSVLGIQIGGGWLSALVNLVIAAIVLMISGSFVRGMRVNGFVGPLVAAIAIGVVAWLINIVLGMVGIGVVNPLP